MCVVSVQWYTLAPLWIDQSEDRTENIRSAKLLINQTCSPLFLDEWKHLVHYAFKHVSRFLNLNRSKSFISRFPRGIIHSASRSHSCCLIRDAQSCFRRPSDAGRAQTYAGLEQIRPQILHHITNTAALQALSFAAVRAGLRRTSNELKFTKSLIV